MRRRLLLSTQFNKAVVFQSESNEFEIVVGDNLKVESFVEGLCRPIVNVNLSHLLTHIFDVAIIPPEIQVLASVIKSDLHSTRLIVILLHLGLLAIVGSSVSFLL